MRQVVHLLSIETPDAYGPWPDKGAVGIDVGLSSLIATSDGETVATPQLTTEAAKKQRRLQRALSRCKRGSKGRLKAKMRLARHSARTANQRRDFAHKLSRNLVDRYSLIAVEDLNISGLARAMLAKSVHNAAWRSVADDDRIQGGRCRCSSYRGQPTGNQSDLPGVRSRRGQDARDQSTQLH